MKLHFWGATDDVTGSMTFLEINGKVIMIDAGLTQGSLEAQGVNFVPTPIDPKDISLVLITHAHLDHSGYLPRLTKLGFRGEVYCTSPTAKLMEIILRDSASLNEELYDARDVSVAMSFVQTIEWEQTIRIEDFEFQFIPAGHILGASSVLIKAEGKTVLFSGDLGRHDDPILPACPPAPKADVVIMESTYGGRNRTGDLRKDLHSFLATISADVRVGIIASFAVARAQTLLTLIHQFYEDYPQFKSRVVADSPMMKEANQVYKRFASLTKHPEDLYEAMNEIDMIDYQGEWESLKKKSGPLIILSSSGMLTGGRIARHLENWQDDKKAILFLPGYQGKGTPGRDFLEGKRVLKVDEKREIHWSGEVWHSDAFSSHADQEELLQWVNKNNSESSIYLLHGEQSSKEALAKKLKNVEIPKRGSIYTL